MNRSFVRATLAAAVLLAAAGAAEAQQADTTAGGRRPSVYLLPSVGSVEGSTLGWHLGDTPSSTGLGDSHVYGLAAQVRTPLRGVDLRAGLSYSRPRLEQERERGVTTMSTSRATVVSATVDAVVRGPRVLALQPYAFAGGGARWFSWGDGRLENAPGTPFVGDQLSPLLRYGAGVGWDVGRYELYLEHDRTHASLKDTHLFRAEQTEDVSWTLGLRIPIR